MTEGEWTAFLTTRAASKVSRMLSKNTELTGGPVGGNV